MVVTLPIIAGGTVMFSAHSISRMPGAANMSKLISESILERFCAELVLAKLRLNNNTATYRQLELTTIILPSVIACAWHN